LDGIYQSDSLSVRPCDVEQQHPMGVACILSGPSTGFVVSVDKPSFCPLSALSPAACRLRVADHCHLLRTPISAVSVAFFVSLLTQTSSSLFLCLFCVEFIFSVLLQWLYLLALP
jgi:hypothetical protein